MGRIKSTLIKRTGRQLIEQLPEAFSESFDFNKKSLGNTTMPSKRIRNKVAGHITRVKKNTHKIIPTETSN